MSSRPGLRSGKNNKSDTDDEEGIYSGVFVLKTLYHVESNILVL